jgi:putative transposase
MNKDTLPKSQGQEETTTFKEILDEIIRNGAQKMLALAIEAEVQEYLDRYQNMTDERGHRLAVRNGSMPERTILSSVGPIPVRQPRVDDRKLRARLGVDGFSSKILPKYLRRTPSLDNLVPALYLRGISTQDFPAALAAILGDKAKGLSANTVVRLKEEWETEYKHWAKRDLSGKHYVYIWADGIYFNVRLKDVSPCILVIIGADESGRKELLAVKEGYRESELSWKALLLELKDQGLEIGPELAIADGALGFWKALPQIYPQSREQRCWVHKTANILDKMAKSVQKSAKHLIHEMYMSETKEKALKAYQRFIKTYEDKYPQAVKCLKKDYDQLFTFYDFPAAHWQHIRTTNPIESTFATVRLRTRRTKGCGSVPATLTMVFKLATEAEKRWRRLRGYKWIPFVVSGEKFIDGEPENQDLLKLAA